MLLGQIIPNNSLVNLDDLAYQSPSQEGFTEDPTNANGRQTLMCVTDLVACCETEGFGNWHLPAGSVGGGGQFRINRGQNEEINGQQFHGSVRIWRRYTPRERGLFRCEIPDANGDNQNFYVNICEFPMIMLSFTSTVKYSNVCSSQCFSSTQIIFLWPSLPLPLVPLLLGRPTH